MTHPLLVWLNDVLKAEETVAQAAMEPWRRAVRRQGAKWPERPVTDEDGTLLAFHNAYHSPPSVLAVVEAHRALLTIHEPTEGGSCDHCSDGYSGGWPRIYPCPTVRALASAYRHHDGWDESWGPT